MCKFIKAFNVKCKRQKSKDWCDIHRDVTCINCGAQATRECHHAPYLACGESICDKCTGEGNFSEHRHFRMPIKNAAIEAENNQLSFSSSKG